MLNTIRKHSPDWIDRIRAYINRLENKYISVEEHEKLKTFYYHEIRKLSKFETPRIKKLKQQYEKEVRKGLGRSQKEVKELKEKIKKHEDWITSLCNDYHELKHQLSQKDKDAMVRTGRLVMLEIQLSQSISIKDVDDWLIKLDEFVKGFVAWEDQYQEYEQIKKSLSNHKEKR